MSVGNRPHQRFCPRLFRVAATLIVIVRAIIIVGQRVLVIKVETGRVQKGRFFRLHSTSYHEFCQFQLQSILRIGQGKLWLRHSVGFVTRPVHIPMFGQERLPRTPVLLANVMQGSVAPCIRHEEQMRITVQQELDRRKRRFGSPAGIVQRGSAVIVRDLDRCTVVEKDLEKGSVSSATNRVE